MADSVSLDLEKAMGRFLSHSASASSFSLMCVQGPLEGLHCQRLFAFLSRHRQRIAQLSLFRVDLGTHAIDNMPQLLQYLRKSSRSPSAALRTIRLRSCQFSGEETHQLLSVLATHGNLEEVVFEGTKLAQSNSIWESLCHGNPDLHTLHVGAGQGGGGVATFGSTANLASGIQLFGRNLTRLSLHACHLTCAQIQPLLQVLLLEHKGLSHLDLHNNQLTSEALPALARLLLCGKDEDRKEYQQPARRHLLELNLASNPLLFLNAPLQLIEDFTQALASNTYLLTLNLRNCGVSTYTVEHLGKALVVNTTLRHLDIRQLALSEESLFPTGFWHCLPEWKSVQTLDVDATRAETDTAWQFLLHRNTSLVDGHWDGLSSLKTTSVVNALLTRNLWWNRAKSLLDDMPEKTGIWAYALAGTKLAAHPTATFCVLQDRLADWQPQEWSGFPNCKY
jgi:hypothetical protein